MRYLNLIDGTIHCKDEEPEDCAKKIVDHIKNITVIQSCYDRSSTGYTSPVFFEFTVRLVD